MNSGEPVLAGARRAASRAHCPYSNFHVGAAVICEDGTVVEGCNVENASFGLSVCVQLAFSLHDEQRCFASAG